MPSTSDLTEMKSRGITARVTERFYDAFAAKAAEVPGRTPSELARQVLEHFIYEAPAEAKIMEELWALRYIVLNGLPELATDRPAVTTAIATIRGEADQKKHDKAAAILAVT